VNALILAKRSNPHNPLIANAFFRSGQIEAWGRGLEFPMEYFLSVSLSKNSMAKTV